MKNKINFRYLFFSIITLASLRAGETSQQMQQLRQNIGNKLIDIKKNNPELEKTVYTLLDEVGTIHKLSGNLIQKRKKIKTAFEEEKNMRTQLMQENETLKNKLKDVETNLAQESSKKTYFQQQSDELAKERSDLIARRAELEAKEREYQIRIKDLEKSGSSKSTPSSEHTIALNKRDQGKSNFPLREKNNSAVSVPQKITV